MADKVEISRKTIVGWWEEYECGCVSSTERRKKDLLGYCAKHGNNRRHVHPEIEIKSKQA